MKHSNLLAQSVAIAALLAAATTATAASGPRQMERLDRGVVASPAKDGGVLVSWRLLGNDPATAAFNVYRNGVKLNARPITDSTNYVDAGAGMDGVYSVRAVVGGREQAADKTATVWAKGYLSIPLQKPAPGMSPPGALPPGAAPGTAPAPAPFTYSASDSSVGDLDGDGRYEIIVKWEPSNARDNSQAGYTGPLLIDAYTLEGKRLWRIDMGINIRAGAHYTQFQVADFDGDGKAEMIAKTGDGTVDGQGKVIGDAKADWRNAPGAPGGVGHILKGPEYITVFNGMTGAAMATTAYVPGRGKNSSDATPEELRELWGDSNGNRSERYLAGTAYLDGVHPSAIMARGYYARATVAAWDWRGGKLTQRWLFDTMAPGFPAGYTGQGNHQFSVADVDGDGNDEILYGAVAIDENGKPLWTSGLGHGDAMHVSDLDPTRPGLEKFGVHESPRSNGGIVAAMLDARTGEKLWTLPGTIDNGRGVAIDVDPRTPGSESWSSANPGIYSAKGVVVGEKKPSQTNFAIWWDGDLLRELLDSNEVSKWDWNTSTATSLLKADGAASNNGTKSTPNLSADLVGDWREELLLRSTDSSELRLYTTPYVTTHRITTLMHDPQYRNAIAWQNTAYNQPPHPGFHLGDGMKAPPKANIVVK